MPWRRWSATVSTHSCADGFKASQAGNWRPRTKLRLTVLDARFHLAVRLRPVGPTEARRAPIGVREIPELWMPLDDPPVPIPFQHDRWGMIIEDLFSQPTQPVKGVLMTGPPMAQRLITRTLDIESPRIAQHQHQELHAQALPPNVGPGTAPIDLRLASGRRFKAHRGFGQSITLGAQGSHRQLHPLITPSIALRLQLLIDPIGVVVDLCNPALHVGQIGAHQRGTADGPLVRPGALLGQETPHRLPINAALARHLLLRLPAPGAGMDRGPQVNVDHLPLPR